MLHQLVQIDSITALFYVVNVSNVLLFCCWCFWQTYW